MENKKLNQKIDDLKIEYTGKNLNEIEAQANAVKQMKKLVKNLLKEIKNEI
jgi:Txe/YoeB family toxin of Txe-Axe toxin-antitoxin module